jgi:hypothetical protein
MKILLLLILAFSSMGVFARNFKHFLLVANSLEVLELTERMKTEGFVLASLTDTQGDTGFMARCPCDNYSIEFKNHANAETASRIFKIELLTGYLAEDGKPKVTIE